MLPFTIVALIASAAVAWPVDEVAASSAQKRDGRVVGYSSRRGMVGEARYHLISDEKVLLQTDVIVSPGRVDGNNHRGHASSTLRAFEKAWHWLERLIIPVETAGSAAEAAKRFHKDFIAAGLIVCSTLSLSPRGRDASDGTQKGRQSDLWQMLTSSQSLRYIAVLLLLFKHYLCPRSSTLIDVLLVIVGFFFDWRGQKADSHGNGFSKLMEFTPRRFVQLYPFYIMHVILCYLCFFSSPCIAESLGLPLLRACGVISWLLSVAFGCYLVVPILASPPMHLQQSESVILCAACAAMVLLPRTLAAPAHGPWSWHTERRTQLSHSKLHVDARNSLVFGLACFFCGLALSRIMNICASWLLGAHADSRSSSAFCATKTDLPEKVMPPKNSDEALWQAFTEQACQEMVHSFSISENIERTYDLSPRSSVAD